MLLRNVRLMTVMLLFGFKPKTLELEGKKHSYIMVQWGDYEEYVLLNERDVEHMYLIGAYCTCSL